jgi:HemY protein
VTGALDAFEWRVPVAELEKGEASILGDGIDGLIAVGERGAATVSSVSSEERYDRRASETIEASSVDAEPSGMTVDSAAPEPASKLGTPLPAPQTQSAPHPTKSTRTSVVAPAKSPEPPKGAEPPPEPTRKPASPRSDAARVITVPHAPDDPGPEEEADDMGTPLRPYRI